MTCVVMPSAAFAAEQLLNKPVNHSLHPANNQSISQSIKLVIADSTAVSQRPSISSSSINQSINQSTNQSSHHPDASLNLSTIQRYTISEDQKMMKRPSVNQLTSQPINQPINQSVSQLINQSNSLSVNNDLVLKPSSHRRGSLDEQPTSPSMNQSINQSINKPMNLSVDEETIAMKNDFGQIMSISTPNSHSYRSINQSVNHTVNQSVNQSINQSINPPTIPSTPTFAQAVSLPAPSPIINQSNNQSSNQLINQSNSIRPLARPGEVNKSSLSINQSNQSINQSVADMAHPFTPGSPIRSTNQSINHSVSWSRPAIQLRASMESLPISFNQSVNQSTNQSNNPASQQSPKKSVNRSTLSPASLSPSRTQSNDQSINQSIFPIRSAVSPRQAVAFREVNKEIKERSINQSINQSINRRTLPSNQSASHLKLPFFSPNNQSVNQSISQATPKTAGPEGYLASLIDQNIDHSITQSNKQSISQSIKRSTVSARKPSFFNSVKQVLKRSSFGPDSLNQSVNQPIKPTIAYSAQVSLSPQHHNLSNQSINQSTNGSIDENLSNNLSGNQSINQSTNHRISFSHPHVKSPSSEDHTVNQSNNNQPHNTSINQPIIDPCVYTHGINRGAYGQSLSASSNQSSLASLTTARKLALATNQSTNQSTTPTTETSFIESWSESDDPLSPASFQQIIPGLFLGSAKSALNLDRLIDSRITHLLTVMNRPLNYLAQPGDLCDADILSFTGQSINQSMKVPSSHPLFGQVMHALTFHFCYLLDVPEADLLSALDDCLPFIYRAHFIEKGHVLIHCQAGISRSASVAIAYVSMLQNQSIKHAFECCSIARPYINPNEGFLTQLDLWFRTQKRQKIREKTMWKIALERFTPWSHISHIGRYTVKLTCKGDTPFKYERALPKEGRGKSYQ